MSRPWQNFPPHRGSQQQFAPDHVPEIYAGPEEYMEIGTRGFLVNILLGKEELGIDDAIELLRQATIKLYGGIKPRSKKVGVSQGYVKIDFMDPESVTVLPAPEGEEEEEIEEEEVKEEPKTDDATHEKQNGNNKTEKAAAKVVKNEKEGPGSKDKKSENVHEKMDTSSADKPAETTDEKQKNKKGSDGGDSEKKTDSAGDKKVEPKPEVPLMKSSYKFKAFRTEIRNLVFVKSNVPDPMQIADSAMEIVAARKLLNGDALRQLLPVLGVCQNDHHHLEVMARRVLAPIFEESLEPKSFSVFLMDKLNDPGADMLIETVRNAIWSINPLAYQSSPLTEPDAVLRLEIVGKKLVLSCLSHFIRYRHYTPKLLVETGFGEPEDDDGTWVPTEVRKMQEIIRAEREKRRELEKQREEEHRKEREKRREEAEARRRERLKEEKEREEKRREKDREREREREKERERLKAEKEAKNSEKEQQKDDATKKTDAVKEKESKEIKPKEGQSTESKEKESKDTKPKESQSTENKEKESKDTKPKEIQSTEQKVEEKPEEQKDEKKATPKRSVSTESPPSKKAKTEESNSGKEDAEKEEKGDESEGGEEDDKKGSPKKGAKVARGGRRKSKK